MKKQTLFGDSTDVDSTERNEVSNPAESIAGLRLVITLTLRKSLRAHTPMTYLSSSHRRTHEAFSTSREVAELKSGRGRGIGSDRTMPKVWLIGRRHNRRRGTGTASLEIPFSPPPILAERETVMNLANPSGFSSQESRNNPQIHRMSRLPPPPRPLEEDKDVNLRTHSDADPPRRLFGF